MKAVTIAALMAAASAAAASAARVLAVSVDGVVHPITVEIISRAVEQARHEHAAAILIRLNTPGGLLDATRQIDQKLLVSSAPVITYVAPSGARAASAGFFILECGDIAAMAPGTNTGAASTVLIDQQMDPVMRSKIENDAAAMLRSMVSKRGRNAQLAETAIRQAKAFTEKEALDNKLIDVVAADEAALFRELNGREIMRFDGSKQKLDLASPEVVEYQKTIREWIISAIADPNIGIILLVVGAL